jgi:hypothetical protein
MSTQRNRPTVSTTTVAGIVRVSAVPATYPEARHWTLTVEHRGPRAWAVCWSGMCLSDRGRWDIEPSPSGRTPDWLAHHRFSRADAISRAKAQALLINVNGHTAADYLARYQDGQQ